MQRRNHIKRRKGFTLVELCVVIAIIGIVGTMVTTTAIFLSDQNNSIQAEASFISDVTDLQSKINDWIKTYDIDSYIIYANPTGTQLVAEQDGTPVSRLSFSEQCLLDNSTKISNTLANVSAVSFTLSENNTGVVQVTVSCKKGYDLENQVLLFPLFSRQLRNRSVSGRNK